jgi:RNA polymerase sigma-70 factor (ECF subfamily)
MDETRLRQVGVASDIADDDVSAELTFSREPHVCKRLCQRALAAWPYLDVDTEPFVAWVLSEHGPGNPRDGLASLAVEDLFLCYACGTGNVLAIDAFWREYEAELKAVANKLHTTGASYEDIRQCLCNKLFLDGGTRRPRILEYRGTGPLRHWFRVLATRTVLDETRKERRAQAVKGNVKQQALSEVVPNADPELDNIRQRYRGEFRSAFERATGLLTPEERNLLRCTYLKGMSTDDIGRAFGMHKATAARHLARARNRLLELTRAELKGQLGADSGELDSIIRLFDGELSISISRLLR